MSSVYNSKFCFLVAGVFLYAVKWFWVMLEILSCYQILSYFLQIDVFLYTGSSKFDIVLVSWEIVRLGAWCWIKLSYKIQLKLPISLLLLLWTFSPLTCALIIYIAMLYEHSVLLRKQLSFSVFTLTDKWTYEEDEIW